MKAVLRHELSSCFTNLSGYVFGAFLLLFAGIYTMVYNLQSATTNFEYVLGSMSFVFLIIVPILTMRVLAEERRQKTDQLLYSLPLSMTQGLQLSEDLPENISVTELLTTSDSAFSKAAGYGLNTYEKEEGDQDGPFALAVLASETLDDGIYSDVIWVSSTSLLDAQTNEMVSGGNQDLFLNMLHYLCQSEDSSITIHAKSLSTEYLTIDSSTSSLLATLVIGLIPVAYLAVGILIWFRRKRR